MWALYEFQKNGKQTVDINPRDWPAVSRRGRFYSGFFSVLGPVADILVSHSSAFHSAFGHLPMLSRVPIILHHVWKCWNTFRRSGKIYGDTVITTDGSWWRRRHRGVTVIRVQGSSLWNKLSPKMAELTANITGAAFRPFNCSFPLVPSDHWVFPNSCNIKMNVIPFLWFRLFTALHMISRGGARHVRSPPALHSDRERGRWRNGCLLPTWEKY